MKIHKLSVILKAGGGGENKNKTKESTQVQTKQNNLLVTITGKQDVKSSVWALTTKGKESGMYPLFMYKSK